MSCCTAPATGQAKYCTQDARLKFGLTLYQRFESQASTVSALTQANQTTSSYKAGIQAYMAQAGITDPAVFELERLEAFAYFQRQFALPVTASIVPLDGTGSTTNEQAAIAYFGTPLWKVVVTLDPEAGPITIGFYRPTVTCRGVDVLCSAGLERDYTKGAILLHELYFNGNLLQTQSQVQEVQEVPVPEPFPAIQQRGNPQLVNNQAFGLTTNRQWQLRFPLQVYGKVLLYSACEKHRAEIKIRSEFALLPTISGNLPPYALNPDGLTYNVEVGQFGGSRLSAASRELSNGQWIGFAEWTSSATLTSSSLASTNAVVTPYSLDQAETFVIEFPTSLVKCAKLYPCDSPDNPCPREKERERRSKPSGGCVPCDERR